MTKRKMKIWQKTLLTLAFSAGFLCLALVLTITIAYKNTTLDKDKLQRNNLGVEIIDNNENLSCYNLDREVINIEELPDYVLNAFIDIEDQKFYTHKGYDIKRIIKSGLVNLKTQSKKQGASTITQQLAKNTLLSNEKTYRRKINEILLAKKIEDNFTKKEILNMYLNTIYFGSNSYGIESASKNFFEKSSKDLTLNEACCLAGIIKSPYNYSPKYNYNKCVERKNLVLKQMLKNKHITNEEYISAINEPLKVADNTNIFDNSYYQQVLLEASKILNISTRELVRDGYKISTYYDDEIQSKVKESLSQTNNCDKLSLVANKNGEVVAFVAESFYDLSQMRRCPASLIKPLIVYFPCITHNIISPATPILDEKINFDGYSPKNVGDNFYGWISAREALAKSLNIPSVKLLNSLGIENAINTGKMLGLNLTDDDNNLSLALGGMTSGVSPLEIAMAYSGFQNNGEQVELHFINKIYDKNNRCIYNNPHNKKALFNAEDCQIMTDMLKSVAQNGTAKIMNDLNFEVASKTGTNYVNNKTIDLWNVAYTTEHLTLTWLGDAKNEGLENLTSSFSATKVNKDIMKNLYNDYTPSDFELSPEIVNCAYDSIEYEKNHRLVLATDETPDRYKIYDITKSNSLPNLQSNICATPSLDLGLKIDNNSMTISFEYSPLFEYSLYKSIDNSSFIKLSKNITSNIILDDDINHEKIDYYLQAKNVYTNKTFDSKIYNTIPKSFNGNKNQYDTSQTTKKRWYI